MEIRLEPFNVSETFPPSDPLAVDLLRLMAGYNDLAFVVEWVEAHLTEPDDDNEKTWAAGRLDLKLRLLYAIMYETLSVLDQMPHEDGFSRLERQLNQSGRSALTRLQQVRTGEDDVGKRLLNITRHKIAYHYDHGLFKKALSQVIERSGKTGRINLMFIKGMSGREQYYCFLADVVRAKISDDLVGGDTKRSLDTLLDLTRTFGTFLESFLIAYSQDRGLRIKFDLR